MVLTPSATESPLKAAARKSVKDGMAAMKASLSCNPDYDPDCELLHDKLSLMWGEFEDKVNELAMITMKNLFEVGELKTNLQVCQTYSGGGEDFATLGVLEVDLIALSGSAGCRENSFGVDVNVSCSEQRLHGWL